MESSDTGRGAAITYALLSLLVRLIASQSSVFNLWFSRRCYERSRGEMITMLYEKTLSRKIIGPHLPPQQSVGQDEWNDGIPGMEASRPKSRCKCVWVGLYGAVKRLFSTTNERPNNSKNVASMGKILNMMRCVTLAVLVSQLTLRPAMTSMK